MSENCGEVIVDRSQKEKKEENQDDYFVWNDYLDATNSKEVPHVLFAHVEQSLQSGFKVGTKVEVPLKDDHTNYWVATIITACGPLLSLRYVGDKEDRSKDFWCEMSSVELHPLGWTELNGKMLVPPKHLTGTISHIDLKNLLKGADTISLHFDSADAFTPIDRIKQGMKVEVQDLFHPYHAWIATITESVGGRLLLRYDTPDSSSDHDFWLFYSSSRIFPLGWTQSKGDPWKLVKPCYEDDHYEDKDWNDVLESSKRDLSRLPSTADIFQNSDYESIPKHEVSVGMKLEAVHPQNRAEICPATIVKVVDDRYFLVCVDDMTKNCDSNSDLSQNLILLATATNPYIFPYGWARRNNLKLTHPRGWISEKEEFDWNEYLEETKSEPAVITKSDVLCATDVGFEIGMKLEVVNPKNEHQICVATIANITNNILWIHLDSSDCFQPSVMFSYDSLELFPVGWCEMNNYPLKLPQLFQPTSSSQSSEECGPTASVDVKSEDVKEKHKDCNKSNSESRGSFWCPKIYFNHKCFSGPFLSKGKLAQLPKAVGPGPVTLVMKEVLSMLISIAYISSRVLRELQCKTKQSHGKHLEVLKAKYKSNAYRASVEIVTSADKVEEFCKEICKKLQVCPYLFGPVQVGEKTCPENCSTLSKTRFCKKASSSSNNDNNSSNNCNSMEIIKKCISRDIDTTDSRNSNRLFAWPKRKRGLEKDYLSGFGKVNDDNESSAKRLRYETRGVKLPNFGPKKASTNSISNVGSTPPLVTKQLTNNSSSSNNSHGSTVSGSNTINCSPVNSESSSVSSNVMEKLTNSYQSTPKKKRGRHSKAKKEELRKAAELASDCRMDDSQYQVDSNPLLWTVEDVYDYLRNTEDCDVLANLLKEEEFDGKSFMLLNLPSCLESLKLNLKTALKLCRHVEAVKYTFFCKYVIPTSSTNENADDE